MIFSELYRKILFYIMNTMGVIQIFLFSLFNRTKKRQTAPPIKDEILLISATKLVDMIRNQKITSLQVISAYIKRCQEVNPILNAIVDARFEEALHEAEKVDDLIKSQKYTVKQLKEKFPLLGLPLTVKESIAVKGLRNEGGVYKKEWSPATKDATPVALARAAGAIPILVSNTPELCMCPETFNFVTGTTNNPYDIRRTPGGSSGGEAALLSSGGSIIGMGSDIAGSLRTPAMYCGIIGMKPTPHVINSRADHKPSADDPEQWCDFFTKGPMVRYAEDLQLLFDVMMNSSKSSLLVTKELPIEKINFFYIKDINAAGITKVSEDIKIAMNKVINYFSTVKKLSVLQADIKYIESVKEVSTFEILKINGVDTVFSKPGNRDEWRSVFLESVRKLLGFSKNTFPTIMYAVVKKLSKFFPKSNFEESGRRRAHIREEFISLLKTNGVLLLPVIPYTAHYHNDYVRRINDICYTGIFNVLGFPAISCPLGLTKNKLPVGVQVVASPGCDYLLFSVAKELEKAFGGWVPPS